MTDTSWLKERLARHISEVLRLAWPVIIARIGIMSMALVDTIMVGHYATTELAYLGIGLTPFMPVFLILLGLLMGTVVMTSAAFGAERYHDCGATWRRSLPYAFVLGFLGLTVCLFGEEILRLSGQSDDLARGGGRIMVLFGLGLPAHLFYVTSSLFLEGIKRPKPGMVIMLVANLVNVFLNWVLIYGKLGFPAMGAEGSAITSSLIRWMVAATIIAYIWTMVGHEKFGVRLAPTGGWRAWARQRHVGYSSGFSIGGESVSFAVMGMFAGWLGTVPLAAYSISHNLIAMAFMVSLGVGSATVVRVSIASGREDIADLRLAGWTGLGVNAAFMALIGMVFGFFPELLATAYTGDKAVIAVAIPLVAICAFTISADGGQAVMVNALRGAGGIWAPAVIQNIAFLGIMVPLGWWFAIDREFGAIGLYYAILVGSSFSLLMLAARFQWVSRSLS